MNIIGNCTSKTTYPPLHCRTKVIAFHSCDGDGQKSRDAILDVWIVVGVAVGTGDFFSLFAMAPMVNTAIPAATPSNMRFIVRSEIIRFFGFAFVSSFSLVTMISVV